jgi:hypothetical protein
MKTYYSESTSDGLRVRYWYDPSLKLWTSHVVDKEDNQMSNSMYDNVRKFICLDVPSYSYLMYR